MPKVRLTRRLDSGVQKLRDRREVVAEDGSVSYEDVFHLIGPEHSPLSDMVPRVKKELKKDEHGKPEKGADGKPIFNEVVMEGQFVPKKDAKGFPVWAKKGKPFEVMDLDYVMQYHGAILELAE